MLLQQGAHYPWETAPSDGHDAAVAPTDWSEQHISLDVALGTIATARALNDSDFNRETAFPVVSNVAGAGVPNQITLRYNYTKDYSHTCLLQRGC